MFKINTKSRLNFNIGDLVGLYIPKERNKREELLKYNLDVINKSKKSGIILIKGRVCDLDSVYQPNMSTDLFGVKIKTGFNKFWILPKSFLRKIE